MSTALSPEPNPTPEAGTPSRRVGRKPRLAIALLLCLTGFGIFLSQHYHFRWPVLRKTPRALLALAAYESGYYHQAATLWRVESGLDYDPTALPQLVRITAQEVRDHPDRLEAYLRLADIYLASGDGTRAAAIYAEALQRDPALSDAAIGLAAIRIRQGAYPEARALLDPLFIQSRAAEHEFRTLLIFLEALDTLTRASGPATVERELTLAYAYRYLAIFDPRQFQTVIRHANRTLALDPRQDAAYFCAGVAYMQQGQIDPAIQQFEWVVQLDPTNAEASKRLGDLYGMRGDPARELAAYRQAIAAAPLEPRYQQALGQVLRKKYGDLKGAALAFREAYTLQPVAFPIGIALAETLEQLRQYPEALGLYTAIVWERPGVAEGYFFLGRCLVSLARYDEAVAAFRQAEQLGPLPAWVGREMAFAYGKLHRLDAAIAAYEAVLEREPQDVDTLYQLQAAYRRVGRHGDAYRAVRRILVLDPTHPGALRLLPYLERNRGS